MLGKNRGKRRTKDKPVDQQQKTKDVVLCAPDDFFRPKIPLRVGSEFSTAPMAVDIEPIIVDQVIKCEQILSRPL